MEEHSKCQKEVLEEAGIPSESQHRHFEIMHALHRIKKVSIAAAMEISPKEFFILKIIEKSKQCQPGQEGIYVSVIAKKAGMAPSQVSRMLRGLEGQGVIVRSIDAKDRRNTYVYLTDKGKTFLGEISARFDDYFIRVMDQMGIGRFDELVRLCNELADVMEKELNVERNDGSDGKNS